MVLKESSDRALGGTCWKCAVAVHFGSETQLLSSAGNVLGHYADYHDLELMRHTVVKYSKIGI